MKRYAAVAAAGLVLAFLVAGCGGSHDRTASRRPPPPAAQPPPPPARPPAPPATTPPPAPRCGAGQTVPLGGRGEWLYAVVTRPTTAFRAPGDDPIAPFGLKNVNGHATVFSVLGAVVDRRCRPVWLHVELPLRPNGETGYVAARDVSLGSVETRVVVDLSRRLVTLYRDGKAVLRARAAIGAPSTPTPTGRFYVNQRLIAPDPSGPYGPAAIGISAFSDVEQDWAQGGPIAIHGTNDPGSIGGAVSHGCIRVENAVLERLFWAVPAGTPVVIRS